MQISHHFWGLQVKIILDRFRHKDVDADFHPVNYQIELKSQSDCYTKY